MRVQVTALVQWGSRVRVQVTALVHNQSIDLLANLLKPHLVNWNELYTEHSVPSVKPSWFLISIFIISMFHCADIAEEMPSVQTELTVKPVLL